MTRVLGGDNKVGLGWGRQSGSRVGTTTRWGQQPGGDNNVSQGLGQWFKFWVGTMTWISVFVPTKVTRLCPHPWYLSLSPPKSPVIVPTQVIPHWGKGLHREFSFNSSSHCSKPFFRNLEELTKISPNFEEYAKLLPNFEELLYLPNFGELSYLLNSKGFFY